MIDNDRPSTKSMPKTAVKGMTVVLVDDTQDIRFGVLSGNGVSNQKCQILSPYGVCSNPPDNSQAIAINILGRSNSTVAIVDDPKNRKNSLGKGEVAIVNYLTGAEVYMKADGSIQITGATDIELNGNADFAVAYTDLKVAFDQLATDFNNLVISYNAATYTIGGVGTTGTTSVPGTPTTADMTSSKVDTVKVP